MNDQRIQMCLDAQGVAEVSLSRPEKMNALDAAMFMEIADVLQRLHQEPGLRAVVLHGAGRAFCAGLDMASFAQMGAGNVETGLGDLLTRKYGLANLPQYVAWGWRQLPVPVIAAVHGVAFGGGLQIALGADIRLVSSDLQMSVMEMKWGIIPDMSGCILMNQLAGTDVVRELCFTARSFDGNEAVQLGLATHVCAEPLTAARAMAQQIASQNPDAIRACKRLLNQALKASDAETLLAESMAQQALLGSANQMEAVRAAMAKRPPRFVDPPVQGGA